MLASTKSDLSLKRLRTELAGLRRRRATVRWGTALATAGLIVLVALSVAFAADYVFDLRPIQRAVALLAIAFAAGWFASSLVGAWLGRHETETDVALAVERRHGLNSDLVAALQFQSDEAVSWGSPRLEQAVIRDVDDATRDLDLLEGFTWRPLSSRAALFAVALAAVIALGVVFSDYAAAFLSRLTLADVSYPTRTVITSVLVNGRPIDEARRSPIRAAAGARLVFAVVATGQQPAAGSVLLENDAGGATTVELKLNRATTRPADGGAYRGTLRAFTEPLSFTVRLGDDETHPRRIELVPRPSVSLDLKPVPPAYAASNAPAPPPPGVRTAFVLEGSSVGLEIRAANKPLREVSVAIVGDGSGRPTAGKDLLSGLSLEASADRKSWTLDPAGTPFENVTAAFSFNVKLVDDDGLGPAEPIAGSIRLRADRPPRVAAGAVVRRVLPGGKPELTYGATDDFGVAAVRAKLAVTRLDGTVADVVVPLPIERESATQVGGRHPLDLSTLSLSKGDRVVVTVEAEDVRGDRKGETATAEPLSFEVTDREGLLASLLEADEEGAARLDAIIRRELGIGEQR